MRAKASAPATKGDKITVKLPMEPCGLSLETGGVRCSVDPVRLHHHAAGRDDVARRVNRAGLPAQPCASVRFAHYVFWRCVVTHPRVV